MINQLRLAGSALKAYLTNPATIKEIGKQVATEAALGTAVQQIAPRLMGMNPGQNLASSLGTNILHSAASAPLEGAMRTVGIPGVVARPVSSMLGSAGLYHAQQGMGGQRPIDPEPHQAGNPSLDQYRQLQAMQMEAENQSYKNQIALAYAKNYSFPTRIVHSNPSADLSTLQGALNQRVNY